LSFPTQDLVKLIGEFKTMSRFILIEPSHNGNVGAAARALKTMGFDELFLVKPRDAKVLNREETIQRASGATDVLAKTQIVRSFDEAMHGVHHLCATAMIARDFGPATYAPRTYFDLLSKSEQTSEYISRRGAQSALKMGFVFGTERFGMKNEDVYRCHVALSIPTNPSYGSLNLASAVQLIAYEWRLALGWRQGGEDLDSSAPSSCPDGRNMADAAAVTAALAHWEKALIHLRFLDPDTPKKLMPRLNDLFNRAQLREEEIHILRGLAKTMLESSPKPRCSTNPD
jgi:tRNA/rRNA methyltransferase